MALPNPNPVDAGWVTRGAPVDYLGPTDVDCPRCGRVPGGRFRVIFGRYVGVGAPFFVLPFLKHQSTQGKTGTRSEWLMCNKCTAFVPADGAAAAFASNLGLPEGFGTGGLV